MKKQIIILIILSLMAVSLIAPTVTEAKLVDETRVIVGFKDFPSEGLIRANGWKVNHEYKTIPAVACSLSTFAIETLKKSPFVSYIEEDTMVALSEPDAEFTSCLGRYENRSGHGSSHWKPRRRHQSCRHRHRHKLPPRRPPSQLQKEDTTS